MNPNPQKYELAKNITGRKTSVVKACLSPTIYEIHRAAGWWAGEGSVSGFGSRLSVTMTQKEVDVLEWARERFGGSIHTRKANKLGGECSSWSIHGARARGFLLTIYGCIPESPRRQKQIYNALVATSKIVKRGPQPKSVCGKGHWKEIGVECKVCANEAQRIRRRTTPSGDIHRRKEYERYWRNPDKAREAARKYREKKRMAT
jgi:hypothetical protein